MAHLASVVDAERAGFRSVGENVPKLGQPHVGAMLGDEPLDVVAPASAARLAHDLDGRRADVGQGDRVALAACAWPWAAGSWAACWRVRMSVLLPSTGTRPTRP